MTEIVLPYDRSPVVGEDLERDVALLTSLMPYVGMVKIGLEAMNARTWMNQHSFIAADVVRDRMHALGIPVLWDAKLHDIGNTMAGAIRNIAGTGMTNWVTVHASASTEALKAAVKARDEVRSKVGNHLRIFGVTVLTDIGADECYDTYGDTPDGTVHDFARKLINVGMDGIVCSGLELEILSSQGLTRHLETLVPGLRSEWADANDQKRVMTPKRAAELGADYAVIGRQIMSADDPVEAARRTLEEIRSAA